MSVNEDLEAEDRDTMDYRDKRQVPRSYPVFALPIYDVDDPSIEGCVLDVTEMGIRVAGMECTVGRRKTFLIQADELGSLEPFSFDAECRWVRIDPDSNEHIAGFEITGISSNDLEELRKIIQSLSFTDLD